MATNTEWVLDSDGYVYAEPDPLEYDEYSPNICQVNMGREDSEENGALIEAAPKMYRLLMRISKEGALDCLPEIQRILATITAAEELVAKKLRDED